MLLKSRQPCNTCGSSDALAVYEDHTYCYSCKKYEAGYPLGTYKDGFNYYNNIKPSLSTGKGTYKVPNSILSRGYTNLDDLSRGKMMSDKLSFVSPDMPPPPDAAAPPPPSSTSFTKQTVGMRGITQDTMKFFGVYTLVNNKGEPVAQVYPYGDKAKKIRRLDKKEFYSEGSMKDAPLFGQDKFSPGQGMSITITEGEVDTMSVYQMLGSKYPCVSVRSASTARSDCERAYKYLNSFDKIYLCFDNDDPGQRACREVASLFDINKVYHVEMGGGNKDANDYLQKGEAKAFTNVWWNAKRFLPKGIIAEYTQIENVLRTSKGGAIGEYPFPSLQSLTYGIRSAELVLFTAQEKVGKTEVMRAIEYHLLKTTDYNIGIIHLEEEEKRSVQGLIGYELNVPVHLPDANVSIDDQIKAYKDITKRDGRLHFYQHFGSDDPDSILDVIRYLVGVCHCKFIFLDHITMLVTGYEDEDERKKLDYISTRLAMLTRELDFTLFLVSHVNDNGQTRGSRNISKVADLIVHLDRNLEGETFDERNKTHLLVRGNRFAGTSGPAGVLWFDSKSFKLSELTETQAQLNSLVF